MKAYQLLDRPEKWTQGCFAVDANGEQVDDSAATACRWCTLGAILRCYTDEKEMNKAIKKIHDVIKGRVIDGDRQWCSTVVTIWNDDPRRTHAEVVGLLRELDI